MRFYIDAANSVCIDREIVEMVHEFIRGALKKVIVFYLRENRNKPQKYFSNFPYKEERHAFNIRTLILVVNNNILVY